jgi:hypothetical protein
MKRAYYQKPTTEILEVAVESGFAQSQQKLAEWEDM